MEAQTQQDLAPLHQEETKSEDTTNEEKLSKKQLKRRQKEVERKEYWQKQRKKEKEKRKLKKQKLKEQGLDVRKETSISTQRKRRKESEIEYGGNLVMDASFDTYHNDKDVRSLGNQVCQTVAANRGSLHPFHITITSYDGRLQAHIEKLSGWQTWKVRQRIHF
eukprot:TRINITY_DN2794_c0_g1_i4.p1 TRINITY_DN2794_c0_g1~~TRINITY_DN2794_c0_g1_i4.p1  ORF type:complete len:164 (+),score=44.48 TRINITY_DN2794_c0_g1_i4:38-529(+)